MKPYWQSADGLIVLYHGDMRELCASLRADAVVTDAPFGIADDAVLSAQPEKRRGANNTWHPTSEWDKNFDPAWCRAACEAAPVVAWFGHRTKARLVEDATPLPLRAEIVWAKNVHTSPPTPIAYRDERIWVFSRDAIVPQHFETTVWDEPVIPTWEHKYHKNQKPERLMSRLVRWVAPPTWTILDPFMGSGTTLLVCQKLGRRCIGIDQSREHCDTAIGRLGAVTAERAAESVGPLFSRTV